MFNSFSFTCRDFSPKSQLALQQKAVKIVVLKPLPGPIVEAVMTSSSSPPSLPEPSKEAVRFYIWMRIQHGESASTIHADLVAQVGIKAPSYDTVARWMRDFRAGRSSLQDEDRPGRPVSVTTELAVDSVRAIVADDPHCTAREIAELLDISIGAAHTILTEKLGLRKICARWIPHLLSVEQRQQRVHCCREMLDIFANDTRKLTDIYTGDEKWFPFFQTRSKEKNRVWLHPDEPRPTTLRTHFQSRKRMLTIFFSSSGAVVVDVLPEKQTMTSAYYSQQVLPKVLEAARISQPTRLRAGRLHILHDNASSHKTRAVQEFLRENKFQTLPHPAYSPDLAPCDFWLFPLLTEKLANINFQRVQDLARRVNSELRAIPKEQYADAFKKWIQRLEKCVRFHGEYFEGL